MAGWPESLPGFYFEGLVFTFTLKRESASYGKEHVTCVFHINVGLDARGNADTRFSASGNTPSISISRNNSLTLLPPRPEPLRGERGEGLTVPTLPHWALYSSSIGTLSAYLYICAKWDNEQIHLLVLSIAKKWIFLWVVFSDIWNCNSLKILLSLMFSHDSLWQCLLYSSSFKTEDMNRSWALPSVSVCYNPGLMVAGWDSQGPRSDRPLAVERMLLWVSSGGWLGKGQWICDEPP